MAEINKQKLAQNIDKLPITEREREMIRYRYGLESSLTPHSLQETGNVFGVTRERIRQVEEKVREILNKLTN